MMQRGYWALLASLAVPAAAHANVTTDHYQYWCVGNCDTDVTTSPIGGTVLMGGGTDVDAAFAKMIEWSGNGDFLVIRAYGDDAYNEYILGLGQANSVATLLTKDASASEDPFVLSLLDKAEAIFIAGGDQSDYIKQWQGTSFQSKIQEAIQRGAPIGGTSAGCDVQSGYIYTAMYNGTESPDALANPYNHDITLQEFPFVNHTLAILRHVLVDTHFITRDRMGRLVTFLARLKKDGLPAMAIGIDEQTAFLIDRDGHATMERQGQDGGRAFVLTPTRDPSTCEPDTPLTFRDITVQKLDAAYGDTYDFVKMHGGVDSQRYTISAEDGALTPSDPYSPPSARSVVI